MLFTIPRVHRKLKPKIPKGKDNQAVKRWVKRERDNLALHRIEGEQGIEIQQHHVDAPVAEIKSACAELIAPLDARIKDKKKQINLTIKNLARPFKEEKKKEGEGEKEEVPSMVHGSPRDIANGHSHEAMHYIWKHAWFTDFIFWACFILFVLLLGADGGLVWSVLSHAEKDAYGLLTFYGAILVTLKATISLAIVLVIKYGFCRLHVALQTAIVLAFAVLALHLSFSLGQVQAKHLVRETLETFYPATATADNQLAALFDTEDAKAEPFEPPLSEATKRELGKDAMAKALLKFAWAFPIMAVLGALLTGSIQAIVPKRKILKKARHFAYLGNMLERFEKELAELESRRECIINSIPLQCRAAQNIIIAQRSLGLSILEGYRNEYLLYLEREGSVWGKLWNRIKWPAPIRGINHEEATMLINRVKQSFGNVQLIDI